LLNKRSGHLELKEHPEKGFYAKDLTQVVIGSIEEMKHIMKKGVKNRVTAETAMNERSSRSHCMFTIVIEQSEIWADGA